tara:strand:+ start:238 stop:402 length:165 start_codon:yes stop_codon:yes gene_type:complete
MIKDIKINVGGKKIDFNTNDILNEVFKNHIKDLQKPERTKMPALDDDGKFVRYE